MYYVPTKHMKKPTPSVPCLWSKNVPRTRFCSVSCIEVICILSNLGLNLKWMEYPNNYRGGRDKALNPKVLL